MSKTIIQLLGQLESTSGSNAKRDILELNKKNDTLRDVFLAVGDPYVVYYVNKLKLPPPSVTAEDDDSAVRSFLDTVLPRLALREVTGNAAKEYLTKVLLGMSADQQKWAMRILLKNLRVGVQETTVNKVWPGLIKGFSVSLAETLRTVHDKTTGIKILDTVTYPVKVEPKLDGLRCVAIVKAGKAQFYTRNGSLLETLPSVAAALEGSTFGDDFVLDGEALGADWNESASVLMSRKYKKDDAGITFHVFDAMPFSDWAAQKCNLSLIERHSYADKIVTTLPAGAPVKRVPGSIVNSERELLQAYSAALNEGHEGVMLKNPTSPYRFKRSDSILKMKPYVTFEGVIVGHYEGRNGTKNEGQFGGFEVVLPNGVVTRVGSGFNDALRAEVQLEGPESFIGKIAELEGQPDPLTSDGLTKDGKVRFPVFCRFRDVSDVDPLVSKAGDNLLKRCG